jgi:hypothetical protein
MASAKHACRTVAREIEAAKAFVRRTRIDSDRNMSPAYAARRDR